MLAREPSRSATPTKNCARIAPELPRAPSMAASAILRSSAPACAPPVSRMAARTAPRVKARLVPVSPSGTGNTLILLRCSWLARTRWMPERSASPRCSPSSEAISTAAVLLARENEAQAAVIEDHTVRRDALDRGAFGRLAALAVLAVVDEHESIGGLVGVDVDVEVQVRNRA